MIRARRHPIPDLVQVTLQVLLERRQGHAVHARSTAVRLHPLVSFPDELLGNVVRLCLRHRLLPSRVGRSLRQECRVPSLRPHYRASSLLRTRPSLRPASVLGSSRVRRLEVSLGIGATGSHVPHKSLSLVSRRLHAGRRSASRQASSELRPRPTTGVWFRRRSNAFDTSSTVHSRSSYQRIPDGYSRLFRNAHHPGHCAGAACGGLNPDPATRVRGADPHLLCSRLLRVGFLHQNLLFAPSWRTVIGVLSPCLADKSLRDPGMATAWRAAPCCPRLRMVRELSPPVLTAAALRAAHQLDEHHAPVRHDDLSGYIVEVRGGEKSRDPAQIRGLRRKAQQDAG